MRIVGWRVGAVLMAMGLVGPVLAASGDAGSAWAAGGNHKVRISHAKFVPQETTIPAGDSVTWSNEDGTDAHSVTADDGSFDSHPDCSEDAPDKCLAAGGTWSHTFNDPGRYPYHSRTEGQHGVVVVTAKS
jgi:plastocyanin